jgi:O-antigen/teichoic acid export membrane protein
LVGALISQNIFYLILLLGLGLGYRDFNFKLNKEVIRKIGVYSFIYGLAVLGNYLFIRMGILILGHYNYMMEIGMYELFNKFFTIFLLPFILFGQVVAPNFTELHIKNKYDVIYLKLKKYTVFFIITGCILGLLIYIVLPKVIYYFLPSYYNSLFFSILPWVTIMYVLNVSAATIDFGILVPIGQAKIMAMFYIILGILGSLLSSVLINIFGYMGVIYSFTISTFIMVIGLRILLFIKINKRLASNF